MVSVVMATYNGEKYLGEQINSILTQTVLPDEIIISDDCSTDNTLNIIAAIQQTAPVPIRVCHNRERLGYCRNFKQALRRAQGEFIFLCDQDDIWFPQKIETCLHVLAKNPQVLSLSTAFQVIDLKNKIRKRDGLFCFAKNTRLKKITWRSFIRYPKYPGMAMVVRRNLLQALFSEIPEETDIPHDWLLNESAAYRGGLYFFGVKLSAYRQHGANTVGMALYADCDTAFCRREQYLTDMYGTLDVIKQRRADRLPFLEKASAFYRTRKILFHQQRFIRLLGFELLHLHYISLRSILGDMYLLIQKSMQ